MDTDSPNGPSERERLMAKALLLLLDRVERAHAKSEEAVNTAFATRTAMVSALKTIDSGFADRYQSFLDQFQSVAGRHSADPQLDEIRRQLSQLLPK